MTKHRQALDTVRVKDYMTTKLITFDPDMDVLHAVNALVKNHITSGPVVKTNGKLVGILSERDCLKVVFAAAHHSSAAGPVRQYMNPDVQTVTPDSSLMHLINLFETNTCRRYPVVDNGKLVGVISRSDIMRAINNLF